MFRYILTSIFITLSTLTYGQGRHIIYQKDEGTASISGNVLDQVRGLPVAGKVIIYEVMEGPYLAIDTAVIDEGGGYIFESLPLGKYILWTSAKHVSSNYPTYYPQGEFYRNTEIIDLKENLQNINISMISLVPWIDARNFFGGEVKSDIELTNGLDSIVCTMYRGVSTEGGKLEYFMYDHTLTDQNGKFVFRTLETGSYLFHIEYPGIPSDLDAYFEYDESKEQVEIIATITNSKINISIENKPILKVNELFVSKMEGFPNPVTHNYILNYELRGSTEILQCCLYSSAGKLVLSDELDSGIGKHQKSIDLENLISGIYTLKVFNADRSITRTLRIVKN